MLVCLVFPLRTTQFVGARWGWAASCAGRGLACTRALLYLYCLLECFCNAMTTTRSGVASLLPLALCLPFPTPHRFRPTLTPQLNKAVEASPSQWRGARIITTTRRSTRRKQHGKEGERGAASTPPHALVLGRCACTSAWPPLRDYN